MRSLAVLSTLLCLGVCITAVMQGCSDATVTPSVIGERSVVRVSAGSLDTSNGTGNRFYVILRDPDTGVDYLAVQDAGIIELKPKPKSTVEPQ